MATDRAWFRLRGGWLRKRRAVTIAEDGLRERLWLGRQRVTPWLLVRAVRWPRPDTVEIVLADSSVQTLAVCPEQAEELVRQLKTATTRGQLAWFDGAQRAALIRGWLGISDGGQWTCDLERAEAISDLGCLLRLQLGGLAGAAMVYAVWPRLAVVLAILVALPALILLPALLRAWLQPPPVQPALSADGDRVVFGGGLMLAPWLLAWRDIVWVATEPADLMGYQAVDIGTRQRRRYRLKGPARALRPLLEAMGRVADANSCGFINDDNVPAPDTALSPARVGEASEHDSGLSRTGLPADGQ